MRKKANYSRKNKYAKMYDYAAAGREGAREAKRLGVARGHWTRGKPRNDSTLTPAELASLRKRVYDLTMPANLAPQDWTKPASLRGLARECGVSDRTLRRWLDGEDHPPQAAVLTIQRWIGRATVQ